LIPGLLMGAIAGGALGGLTNMFGGHDGASSSGVASRQPTGPANYQEPQVEVYPPTTPFVVPEAGLGTMHVEGRHGHRGGRRGC
jgi:hypothetical protein